jgi:hypothetical protein
MISEAEAVARALHSIETALDHAVAYKQLFHSMQDEMHQWQDKCIAQKAIMKKQRQIIRNLEDRLGVDQDL